MSEVSKKRAHVFVRGRVQGVFFRANTRKEARKKGLAGWVKNLPDGRVEAVIEGEKAKVEELVSWMREGPRMARVEEVEVTFEEAKNEFDGFRIKR